MDWTPWINNKHIWTEVVWGGGASGNMPLLLTEVYNWPYFKAYEVYSNPFLVFFLYSHGTKLTRGHVLRIQHFISAVLECVNVGKIYENKNSTFVSVQRGKCLRHREVCLFYCFVLKRMHDATEVFLIYIFTSKKGWKKIMSWLSFNCIVDYGVGALKRLTVRGSTGAWDHCGEDNKGGRNVFHSEKLLNIIPLKVGQWDTVGHNCSF